MISSYFVILESDAESEVEESEIPKNLDQPPQAKIAYAGRSAFAVGKA